MPDDPEPARSSAKSRSQSKEPRETSTPGNFGQPLLIFLITAALIGAGVWGFLQIEDKISTENPDLVEDEPKNELQPLPSAPSPPPLSEYSDLNPRLELTQHSSSSPRHS